jgi:hypothetical protein
VSLPKITRVPQASAVGYTPRPTTRVSKEIKFAKRLF